MSDHLVVCPAEGWDSWELFVKTTKVRFERKQLRLGERLLSRTKIPQVSRVLKLSDISSRMMLTEVLSCPFSFEVEPVHPMYLLALAYGIQDTPPDSIFRHMQYDMAMSPYILTDEQERQYIFLLKNDGRHFFGEFLFLSEGDAYIPRCTHVLGYSADKEPNHQTAELLFRPDKDGKYGRFYS